MAFDVFAGAFARFHTREWENVMQTHARETGMEYRIIHADGDPEPVDWKDVEEAVDNWRAVIQQGLGPNAPKDLDWSEGRDTPYFTDRPGWPGYEALVLLAACTAFGEPLPKSLPEDALASEIVERTFDPKNRDCYRAITMVQLWIPATFDFAFQGVDLADEPVMITSVDRLNLDLATLQAKLGISDDELAKRRYDGYEDDSDCRTLGLYGLAIFSYVAKKAKEHRLPILLSF